MANVIYILGSPIPTSPNYFAGLPIKTLPIVDSELQINYETEFGSFNDLVPSIGSALDALTALSTGTSGSASSGLLGLKNMFSVQRWQNTKPARVNVKLHFYTKTNPAVDVSLEMQDLINLFILTKNPMGGYYVPGISLKTMNLAMKPKTDYEVMSEGKFCAIKIPGMLFLAACMVTQCTPTYSNERTTSGHPLWGMLDIEFSGLYPASPDCYDNFPNMINVGFANANPPLPVGAKTAEAIAALAAQNALNIPPK